MSNGSEHRRATADIIVITLTGIVGFVVISSTIGAVIWRIQDPDADLAALASRVGDITNTLIGAIVGYLAGKGTGAAGALREQRRDNGGGPHP
jgi:hypothetical protein